MWSLNTSQKHLLIPVINVKWFLQLRAIFLFTDQENTNKTELDNIEINLLNLKFLNFYLTFRQLCLFSTCILPTLIIYLYQEIHSKTHQSCSNLYAKIQLMPSSTACSAQAQSTVTRTATTQETMWSHSIFQKCSVIHVISVI